MANTTNQVAPNPTGKGGFGDNPQNRNPGGWKKSDTARYKLEQMLKLSAEELKTVIKDSEAPLFERKLAEALIKSDWKVIREMTHEVYGTPKQSVDVTSGGEKIRTVVEFIDGNKNPDSTGV